MADYKNKINPHTGKLQKVLDETSINTSDLNNDSNILGDKLSNALDNVDDYIENLQLNTMLNAFRIAINGSLSRLNMIDSSIDEYEDESGIDTVNSIYENYDSLEDLYEPEKESGGIDSDTKLMLHCDGNDGSTNYTDDSPSEHTIVAKGNVQIDTAQKKWGTASSLHQANHDWLEIADSSDWDLLASNADDWTIDFWIKLSDTSSMQYFIQQYGGAPGDIWRITHTDGSGLQFYSLNGGAGLIITDFGGEINDNDWHHVALCKVADKYGIYLDGIQVCWKQSSAIKNYTGTLQIGNNNGAGAQLKGWIDEIHIQHSNFFNANPNSGKTDTIDIPTGAYSETGIVYNMILISNSAFAQSGSNLNNGRIVIFEEDVDSITLNTDIKAYISRDGGTTYSEITLNNEGKYSGDKRILSGTVDISGQPAGTDMKYKITTHNNKDLYLHGVGILWD